jgi:hypothetical protein
MTDMSFDDVYRAVMKLPLDEQDLLVSRLMVARGQVERVTREQIIAEGARLKAAGAFDGLESLEGKFRRSGQPVDADEVETYLRSLNSQWEEDLDQFAE